MIEKNKRVKMFCLLLSSAFGLIILLNLTYWGSSVNTNDDFNEIEKLRVNTLKIVNATNWAGMENKTSDTIQLESGSNSAVSHLESIEQQHALELKKGLNVAKKKNEVVEVKKKVEGKKNDLGNEQLSQSLTPYMDSRVNDLTRVSEKIYSVYVSEHQKKMEEKILLAQKTEDEIFLAKEKRVQKIREEMKRNTFISDSLSDADTTDDHFRAPSSVTTKENSLTGNEKKKSLRVQKNSRIQ
jgi:hypothetical protein